MKEIIEKNYKMKLNKYSKTKNKKKQKLLIESSVHRRAQTRPVKFWELPLDF